MSVVTEAVTRHHIENACRAFWNASRGVLGEQWDDDHVFAAGPPPQTKANYRHAMRAALTAVAPLIAKAERERCAKVVEAHQAEVQRNIDDNISEVRVVDMRPSDNWPLIKARDWLKHTAANIRALGDAT
jgi:hypothetical protein